MAQSIWKFLITRRIYVLMLVHVVVLTVCYELSFQLRFDLEVNGARRDLFWRTLPWLILVKLVVFQRFGSFHGWWRYITFADLALLLRASFASTLLIAFIDYFIATSYQIPRSVLAIDCSMTILVLGGLRSIWRLGREHMWFGVNETGMRRALMVGADDEGAALAHNIHHNPRLNYRLVGLLHPEKTLRGLRLGGIPVLGTPKEAAMIAKKFSVGNVLVITNSISGAALREMMKKCETENVQVRMIPPVEDLLDGRFQTPMREVDIDDLLRREPVELDSPAIDSILRDRCVMVTGAGGSIGSEICRQVLRRNPRSLVLVERAEYCLFQIHRELIQLGATAVLHPRLADITDEERMQSIFEEFRPHVVFHAAAHKHVPMMEDNPGEAVKNNIFGTMRLARQANEFGVERFVMISTDKAVNPTSVMGVSKQLAERFVHAYSQSANTIFVVVRFGNVLASTGSVVPIFQEQIRRGGPVTITSPSIERYFMTIPEASQLVLQAGAMGEGGEIFVLDMGAPVKIMDLAKDLIRLSGRDDIEIEITGLRPGEKMFEELSCDDEQLVPTSHPKVRVANARTYVLEDILQSFEQLSLVINGTNGEIRMTLKQIAPEYMATGRDSAIDDELMGKLAMTVK